jgi:hypothetical protein
MKKNKMFLLGILAVLLTFALALAGCDNGSTDSGGNSGNADPKTLVITNITDALLGGQGQPYTIIGIFPVGTTLAQAESDTGIVAGAESNSSITLSGSVQPYTATALLYAVPDGTNRWTGSGTYDIYLVVGDSIYRKRNVSFTAASTSVAATSFEQL